MKHETATAVADVLLLAAAGAVTWLIVRDPRLRKPAFRLLWTLASGTIPAYLATEIRTAWAASGQRNQRDMMAR